MNTVLLLLVGLGSPAIALLVGRWLAVLDDDSGRAMREHRAALVALRDLTRSGTRQPWHP